MGGGKQLRWRHTRTDRRAGHSASSRDWTGGGRSHAPASEMLMRPRPCFSDAADVAARASHWLGVAAALAMLGRKKGDADITGLLPYMASALAACTGGLVPNGDAASQRPADPWAEPWGICVPRLLLVGDVP